MKNPEKNWVHNNDLLHVAPIQKLNHNIVFTRLYINQIYFMTILHITNNHNTINVLTIWEVF